MFGLESCVERVETLVTSEGSDAAPRYVGVSGMGGVGKTLLLQRLYGSAKVHGHFQGAEFIWLTVGQTPDIMALYRTLSKKLHLDPELHANLEDYKLKLHSHFRQKRVFLVLDDVWQEEAFDSLVLAKGKGSVTLLSTRNKSLLERGSPHISQVQMIPLSKKDSWSLFCVHAFGAASGVPSELKALAQSVAEECQGLPLALKVIGGTMFRKASCEWKEVLKKLRESRLQERNVEKQLYERLKLGYGLLSEDDRRLKDCFLCFSAFPEDHMIDFHEILRLWMGEGLVSGNGGDDARVDAFSLLKKLWKRSFIELEEWDVTRWDDGNLFDEEGFLVFKIHDVMRDLAFYILKNDSDSPPAKQLYLHGAGQNLEEIPHDWKVIPEALRLSLKSNKLKTLPGSFCAPKLLSLLLGGNPIQSVPESFLSNFPKLRVLNLTHGRFDILPDKLGDLKDLVCLDLSHCEMLEQLPETVVELHKLKYLILRGCYELKYLPSGVAKLTSLQVLHTTKCYSLTWAEHTLSGMGESSGHADATIRTSLKDICELVFLTQLSICGERDGVFQLDKPLKMLPCFKQLQELDFSDFCRLEYLPDSFTYPGAFPALIKLGISWCALVRFPEVREGALPELQKLDFTGCYSLKDLPLSLEFLTNLRQLIVSECNDTVKSFCRRYCKISEAWRKFEIKDEYGSLRSWIEDEYESLRR
jgi:hypothetical protein